MNTRTLVRGIVAAMLTLAGAGFAPTAQAAPPPVEATVSVRWGASHDGTPGCSVSGDPSGYESAALPFDGGAVFRNIIRSAVVTDTGNAHSTQTVERAKATASAIVRNGVPVSLDLVGGGRVGITADAGNPCGTSAFATAEQEVKFTLVRPMWLTMTAGSGRETTTTLRAQDPLGNIKFRFASYDTATEITQRWYLVPGEYELGAAVTWYGDAAPGASTSRDGSGRIHLDFAEVGSASSRTVGAGAKYAALGSQVVCASATVPVTFTGKAKRVRTATFLVNGKKVRTVRKPRAGAVIALRGFTATRPGTVRVNLVVDPPGKRTKATTSVTRSYRACAAPLNPDQKEQP